MPRWRRRSCAAKLLAVDSGPFVAWLNTRQEARARGRSFQTRAFVLGTHFRTVKPGKTLPLLARIAGLESVLVSVAVGVLQDNAGAPIDHPYVPWQFDALLRAVKSCGDHGIAALTASAAPPAQR